MLHITSRIFLWRQAHGSQQNACQEIIDPVFWSLVEIICWQGPLQDFVSRSTKTENHHVLLNNKICQDLNGAGGAAQTHPKATFNLQGDKWISFTRATEANRNLSTSGLDSGSSWLDGVNGILMQQEPNSPKQDYWNQRAIASLANTLITVIEPVPMPLLSSMLLLQL
jgi:hypothetical protein